MERDHDLSNKNTVTRAKGVLTDKGVAISRKEDLDQLSQKGYGTKVEKGLHLTFYEALFLLDRGILEVKDKDERVDFQKLLNCFEKTDENAWIKYLTYRDLRSRGYVVREGFGLGIDFRLYERGEYSKSSAKNLVLSMQEGKPLPVEDMINAVHQAQRLKKELILAVMNRRGETVYYSLAQMTMK
jgi:tRNA-intron endonuclease